MEISNINLFCSVERGLGLPWPSEDARKTAPTLLVIFGVTISWKSTLRNLFIVLWNGSLKSKMPATLSFNKCMRAKKPDSPRPIISRFLCFPDREKVFKRALELKDEIDFKLYADYPREI